MIKLKAEISKLKEENDEMSKHKKEAEKLTDEVDGLQFQILEEKDKSAGLKMKIDGMIANHQSAIDDLKK